MNKHPVESYDARIAAPFIAEFEGCELEAYKCPAGYWTIGYGHTGDVHPGDQITEEMALQVLSNDLQRTRDGLATFVHVPVSEGQFVALMSLAFNMGVQGMRRSCPKLIAALNAGDEREAAHQFLDCDRADGRRLPGLTARRRAEAELFLSEVQS